MAPTAIVSDARRLVQRTRELGIELNDRLVGLRRTLRFVLGVSHPHYRSLVVRRGRPLAEGETDDADEADDDGADGVDEMIEAPANEPSTQGEEEDVG